MRALLYVTLQRWYWIIAVFLAGSLLGLLVALIWPAPYHATTELYVGLDPYRAVDDRYVAAYAGSQFRNTDDYKYWQMEQLNGLAFFDDVLQATLARLQAGDPSWKNETIVELRSRLHVYWRNAGRWRLAADDNKAARASAAVEAWQEVIFEKANAAIKSSQSLFDTDLHLRAVVAEQVGLQARQTELAQIRSALLGWQSGALQGTASPALGASDRLRLSTLAARAAGFDLQWQVLLQSFPDAAAGAESYRTWIDQAVAAIDQEASGFDSRAAELESEAARLQTDWQANYEAGRGLAATLLVEKPSQSAPQVEKIRPTGLTALVGGLLAVLAYLGWILVVASRPERAEVR